MFGSIIAAIGQSYVYLSFTAFIVSWTRLSAGREDVAGLAVWPVCFLVVALPIWMTLIRARVEGRESGHANPQVEALHLTTLVALVGFVVFAIAPVIVRVAWGWVPYVA